MSAIHRNVKRRWQGLRRVVCCESLEAAHTCGMNTAVGFLPSEFDVPYL